MGYLRSGYPISDKVSRFPLRSRNRPAIQCGATTKTPQTLTASPRLTL